MKMCFVIFREAENNVWLIIEAIILLLSLIGNIILNLIVAYQERNEIVRLVKLVLEDLASMYDLY